MRAALHGLVLVAAGMAAGALLTTATPLVGQAPSTYRAPRAPDGRPDLNGIWQALNEGNFDLEMHPARPVLALGAVGAVPPGVGVVEGGSIPYKPEALAKRKENQERWLERDPEIKCYLPGVPRATYMPYPFQILQSQSAFFIAYEYAGAVRNLYFEDPGPPPADSWMGQSVARWEGETLVVDVTGFNAETWFDRSGNFHSEALRVVERYTRIAPDAIWYEARIEDPNVFTRPWAIAMPLYRRLEKNAMLLDFKCVEFVEELMYGQWRKNPLPR
jgi:hypothetical protein